MIQPSKVESAAEKKEDENWRFRTFLKNHADVDELDEHFFALHNELFNGYDCSKCRNCCRSYNAELRDDEIGPIAATLGLSKEDFIAQRLTKSEGKYSIESPCCFLDGDGGCSIEENRPKTCKEFPFTNKPGRLWHLIGTVTYAEQCPVVFEMLERLKAIYHFKPRR